MNHAPDEETEPDHIGPASIDRRVFQALTAAPTPHRDFIASGRTAEVRLVDGDGSETCLECHGRLSFERESRAAFARTLVSCEWCGRTGEVVNRARGARDIRWNREG